MAGREAPAASGRHPVSVRHDGDRDTTGKVPGSRGTGARRGLVGDLLSTFWPIRVLGGYYAWWIVSRHWAAS